jgi:predicted HicB family RNase H-like nuclease
MAEKKRSRTRKPAPQVAPIEYRGTKLVQARVPAALYARITRAAENELISVAAYVRRTLQNTVPGG